MDTGTVGQIYYSMVLSQPPSRDTVPLILKRKHRFHLIFSKLEETDPASLFSCDVDNPLLQVLIAIRPGSTGIQNS
jgi:hypothetical protein